MFFSELFSFLMRFCSLGERLLAVVRQKKSMSQYVDRENLFVKKRMDRRYMPTDGRALFFSNRVKMYVLCRLGCRICGAPRERGWHPGRRCGADCQIEDWNSEGGRIFLGGSAVMRKCFSGKRICCSSGWRVMAVAQGEAFPRKSGSLRTPENDSFGDEETFLLRQRADGEKGMWPYGAKPAKTYYAGLSVRKIFRN